MALTFFLRLSLSADEDDADHEDKQRHNGGCDHGHDDDDVRIPNALQEPDAWNETMAEIGVTTVSIMSFINKM